MPLLLKNRVLETCTSPGTGSVTLLGASTGYQSFNTAYSATSSTVYYTIVDQSGANWEVGVGTFTPTATLSRDTVLSSSAGGTTKVNFSSGTQNVWVDYPAEKAVIVNDLGDVLINQSYDQGTGVLQVTGQSTFNGAVTDKSLNLQGGNNLVTYSGDYSNASWVVASSGGGVNGIKTPNYGVAPDGTTTACRVQLDVSAGSVAAQSQLYHSFTSVSGTQYALSSWVKTNDGTTKTIMGFNAGTTTPITLTITGTWQLFTSLRTSTGGADYLQYILINGTTSSTADLLIWHPQIELGTVASAYTPTTTSAITTTNNISVPSGQVLGFGTASAPLIADPTYKNNGFNIFSGGVPGLVYGATPVFAAGVGINISLGNYLGWTSTTTPNSTAPDLTLYRDAANTLAQRNSTNAQTFRLYNTYTDASNYERLSIDWSTTANTATISTQNAGTGSARTLAIGQDLYVNSVRVGLGGGSVATNTAVGTNAMLATATGTGNVGVGSQALRVLTSGANNSAMGNIAGLSITTGSQNTIVGAGALQTNTSGSNNSAFGYNCLFSNTTSSGNSGFGFSALGYNFSGSNSTSIGNYSLTSNTTASNLTAIGYSALTNNTTNVATLGTITGGTGYTNGTYTGVVMTLSSGSSAITYPTATIVVAGGAVTSVTITSAGVGFKDTTTVLTAPAASIGGTGSGFSVPVATLQSGTGNVAVGYQAGYSNSTASYNNFNGYQAGYSVTTGSANAYAGYQSGYFSTTASNNCFYGNSSGLNISSGGFSVAMGSNALRTATTVNQNVAIGYSSLNLATSANNTATGYFSLQSTSSGANNTAFGCQAGTGNSSANANTTGANNTYLGFQTVGSANNNTNEMVIGYQAVGLGSNTTVIGNSSTTLTKAFGVIVGTNYTVATLPSASTSGVGARAFVTDALAPSFGVAVTGGGAVKIPVYSDGTSWYVG